jgi:hypothetical protein
MFRPAAAGPGEDASDWSRASFVQLATLDTVESVWHAHRLLAGHISRGCGSFFVMRQGVWPRWEEPEHTGGGTTSYVVPLGSAPSTWVLACAAAMGETMGSSVLGLSISPKRNSHILKVWTAAGKDGGGEGHDVLMPVSACLEQGLYRAHGGVMVD